ncbi:MAG: threonylcarbamoyl-AMP synthase [Desulfobacterium sp.]|nr:threonylcarbamoyl-AMP synthase [Desulfobacterium sp.]
MPLNQKWQQQWNKKQRSLKTSDKIISIDSNSPQPEFIQMAAGVILNGGMVIFPTTCLYGLAADALNPVAVQNVFKAKQRSENNPLLVLVKNRKALESIVTCIPPVAVTLMETFWPGGLTLVFNAGKNLPQSLTAGTGKIGIRIPAHKVAVALVNALENPIIGTSANLSQQGGCSYIPNLDSEIVRCSDLILDAGLLKGGLGSTVIDVTTTPPVILREGLVSEKKIHLILKSVKK